VDLRFFVKTLLEIPPEISLLVVIGYIAGQVISAFKWRLLAVAGGISVTFREALKAYFIGMFVNCFGLGMVGGDVVRGVLVSGDSHSRTLGVTSVIADRLHGLAVLAGMGALSAVIFRPDFLDLSMILLLSGIGISVAVGWIFAPQVAELLLPRESQFGAKLVKSTMMLTRDSRVLISTTLVSIAFHLCQIGLHWIMAMSFGVSIPIVYLIVTVPFINILSSLPISWNGVGVREAGYLFFFSQQHPFLTQEQAVAMGVIWLIGVTVASSIGGIVAFLSKDFSFRSPVYQ
ncbi:MAG: flippase-like domain-containing protein, partial [Bdellovibrionales bacterium]|nr:flippase-like domain-containing protein [Bdellovibrionales bacterium]